MKDVFCIINYVEDHWNQILRRVPRYRIPSGVSHEPHAWNPMQICCTSSQWIPTPASPASVPRIESSNWISGGHISWRPEIRSRLKHVCVVYAMHREVATVTEMNGRTRPNDISAARTKQHFGSSQGSQGSNLAVFGCNYRRSVDSEQREFWTTLLRE